MSTDLIDKVKSNSNKKKRGSFEITDAKNFIADVEKKRENWLFYADKSWKELTRTDKDGRIFKNVGARKRIRYPLWWSAFKVRQPLVLSRIGIPIGKDTSGLDDFDGATAAVILERLAKAIRKTYDALPVFQSARDDALATNLGSLRAFYEREEVKEQKRERLQQLQIEGTEDFVLVNEAGEQVQTDAVKEDEDGFYLETDEVVGVQNERVYLDHVLYKDLYIDPMARRWSKVKELAWKYEYSYREFSECFGNDALDSLPKAFFDKDDYKRQPINVYEFWRMSDRKVYWFAEDGEDFIKPKEAEYPENDENYDGDDLYNLEKFFPCVEPLISNAPTDSIYPVPEYYQVLEIIEHVHNVVSRMFLLAKAIRIRFLFDSSVTELKQLVDEVGEADGIGVPNLTKMLVTPSGGAPSLLSLVAYFPVNELITGLQNMYQAFDQGVNMFYQMTSISDLLRGQTAEGDKTFGERQMEGKYALNRIAEDQQAMQEYIANNDMLLCEMALKNFTQESLDEYIVPRTLEPEQQARYYKALDLLKNDRKRRFRIELETDSTISINQEYSKAEATNLANTLTTAFEKTAQTATTSPDIAAAELEVLQHLISQFSNGKVFKEKITKTIEDAIAKQKELAAQPPPPPPFDKDAAKAQYDQAKLAQDGGLEQLRLQVEQSIQFAQIAQKDRDLNLKAQIEQMKLIESDKDRQMKLLEIQNLVNQGWEKLNLQKVELLQVAKEAGGKQQLAEFKALIDARVQGQEASLKEAQAEIDNQLHALTVREQYLTEQRLVAEQKVEETKALIEAHRTESDRVTANAAHQLEAVKVLIDAAKVAKESKPEPQKQSPKKRKTVIKRDDKGEIAELFHEEVS